jgi:hypothetical protein
VITVTVIGQRPTFDFSRNDSLNDESTSHCCGAPVDMDVHYGALFRPTACQRVLFDVPVDPKIRLMPIMANFD